MGRVTADRNLIHVEGVDRTFHRYKVLFVILVPIAMALMSISSINVALPTIEADLGATASDLQWVLAGYALTFGITLIPAGRAGDLLGRGLLFMVGLAVFTFGSLACGLADTPLALNTARFAQGIGAGLYNPQAMGMIQQYFSGRGRAKAFALFGMVVSVSVAIGPLMAGTMIQWLGPHDGWRASFLIMVPLGLVGLAVGLRWLPFSTERRLWGFTSRRRGGTVEEDAAARASRLDLDPVGTTMLASAVLMIMFPFTARGAGPIWLLAPAGLLLVFAWIRWEQRYKARGNAPMVDLDLFAFRSFTYGSGVSATAFLGMTSIFVVAALFLQQGLGVSAFATGLITLPNALVSVGTAYWSGQRVLDYGRTIVIGALATMVAACLATIGVAWLVVAHDASFWWLAVPWTVAGLGQGALGSANQTLTVEDVPPAAGGTAGGVMSTGQRMGTAIGNAMITSVFFGAVAAADHFAGLLAAYLVISAVLGLAMVIAIGDLRAARRRGVDH